MINAFDIYIAYVSWGSGGKSRPVLVVGQHEDVLYTFNITTQYEHKSVAVRAKYFKIEDWAAAGLVTQSYVDTNTVRELAVSILSGKEPVGKLTKSDEYALIKFIGQ